MVEGGVEVLDDDAVLDRLAGAFVGGLAVEMALLEAAAVEQDGAGVGEVLPEASRAMPLGAR